MRISVVAPALCVPLDHSRTATGENVGLSLPDDKQPQDLGLMTKNVGNARNARNTSNGSL